MTRQELSRYLVKWGEDFVTGMSDVLTEDALRQLAEPRDETETLATCPACSCMGHHLVEVTTWKRRTAPGMNGELIDMSGFGDPPDGAKVVWRTCMFCAHRWGRS